MTPMQCVKGVGAATATGVLVGVVISCGPVRAWDDDAARVSEGFKIAPVPLNLAQKNKALVGLSAIPCIAGPPKPSPLHHDCR